VGGGLKDYLEQTLIIQLKVFLTGGREGKEKKKKECPKKRGLRSLIDFGASMVKEGIQARGKLSSRKGGQT